MKKGIILVAILLLPSIVYLLFSLGTHNTSRLDQFGQVDHVDENGDTIVIPVQIPQLRDESDMEVGLDQLNGKVVLVHLFPWPCEGKCIDHFAALNNYLGKVGQNSDWQLLSICTDYIREQEIADLSNKVIYDGGNWRFCRGVDGKDLNAMVEYMFVGTGHVKSIEERNIADVVLLDQNQRIRGFFDLNTQQDNKKLQDAIKLLIQEPHISWKEE